MNKGDRQKVLDKCNGRCAYCGCELTGNKWHIDHCEPVNRIQKRVPGYYKHKVTGERFVDSIHGNMPPGKWYMEYERVNDKYVFDKMMNPENDTIENSLPACLSCNITKSNYNIDEFRKWIEQTVEAMNKARYNNYKFAKRFGQVHETIKPVVFYFETINKIKKYGQANNCS